MDEKNLSIRKIEEKRIELEKEYRIQKKYLETIDENLTQSIRKMDSNEYIGRIIKQDQEMLEIYEERQALFSSMRRQQIDLADYIDDKFKSDMIKLDEEIEKEKSEYYE